MVVFTEEVLTENLSFCGLGFYFVDAGGAQWRLPLAIQCFFTLALGFVVWFLPESPRWCEWISPWI